MNTLTACKQYIQSKGCTLWRDWDVSTPDGLDKAAAALRDDVDGVVAIKTEAKAAAIGLPVGVPENFAGSPYFQGQRPDPHHAWNSSGELPKYRPSVPIDHERVEQYVADRARDLPPLGSYVGDQRHLDDWNNVLIAGAP